MAGKKGLVSIGMPVYNGARFIREALESLLGQDYSDFELIISDNASTDDTPGICRDYAARDNRITYRRADRNMGAVWNFHRVFDLSNGEFFMWAAHDDFWHPGFITRCMQALEDQPEAVLCHSYTQPVSSSGEPHGSPYVGYVNTEPDMRLRWRRMMRHWELHAAIYGLMRRAVVARVRPIQACMCSDLVFVAELALHGEIIQVPETLSWKRVPSTIKEYRTPEEILEHAAGSGGGHKRLRLIRLELVPECLRGLKHAKLEPQLYRQLYWDTWSVYVTGFSWLTDLKECIAMRVGAERYDSWVRPIKRALGRNTVN